MRAFWLLAALVGCGRVEFTPRPDADSCAAELVDLGRFSDPVPVAAANLDGLDEDDPTPSDDGLELFFTSNRSTSESMGKADVYRIARDSVDAPWGLAQHVEGLSTADNENTPELSSDALTMWLVSDRTDALSHGLGLDDIYVTRRATREGKWSLPENVSVLNSTMIERGPSLFLGGRAMMFHSDRNGPTEFFVSTRADTEPGTPWSTPVPQATPAHGLRGWISPCGLELYFEQAPASGGKTDFYVARRASVDDLFGPEQPIMELSKDNATDQDIRLSPDRRHAYFASDRGLDSDIYEASR